MLTTAIITFSCSSNKTNEEVTVLKTEIDSLKTVNKKLSQNPKEQIATFLTFQDNNAENAMNFYVDIFDNSKIEDVIRWTKDAPGEEGKIMTAKFYLNGSLFMCSDSPPIHKWDFSPAVSNFVECKSEAEIERLFSRLSENGNITMPLNNYGFSKKFGWVIDQYNISWQLNLN